MLNYNEVNVINRAIDGKDIVFMPSFRKNALSPLLISSVKDEMVKKKYLKDYNTFSDKGVVQAKKIILFKDACKYISIEQMHIACIGNSIGVVLKSVGNKYSFTIVNMSTLPDELSLVYPFIHYKSGKNINSEPVEEFEIEDLNKKFVLNKVNSFTLSTHNKDGSKKTKDTVFLHNKNLYRYDANKKKLYYTDAKEIIQLVKERITDGNRD